MRKVKGPVRANILLNDLEVTCLSARSPLP